MNIMYIHGFGSMYDPNASKIQTLSLLGEVFGINYDSAGNFDVNVENMLAFVADNEIDVVVGTSLGGYYASHVGTRSGVPFVAINPAINPSVSLLNYPANGTDYYGREYSMDVESVRDMPSFELDGNGCGLVLLDMGDDVIDPNEVESVVTGTYDVVTFEGGTHRFEHMNESIEAIQSHVDNSFVSGLEWD